MGDHGLADHEPTTTGTGAKSHRRGIGRAYSGRDVADARTCIGGCVMVGLLPPNDLFGTL